MPWPIPYLAFSALLLARLDGIRQQIRPGRGHSNQDLFELTPEQRAGNSTVPGSL